MGKRTYPNLICVDCADRTGKVFTATDLASVTQTEDVCDICKRKGIVMSPKDLGHFNKEQIAQAKIAVKGAKGGDVVSDKDIDVLLTIVDGLGDAMSYWTRKVFNSIKEDFERGKKLHRYDMEKMMYWYKKDVEMRENRKDGSIIQEDGESNDNGRESSPVEGRIIYARN